MKYLIHSSFSLIILAILILLNLFVNIRFFTANTARIGPQISFLIYYLNFLEKEKNKYFDIFIPSPKSNVQFANSFLESKIKNSSIKTIDFFFNENLIFIIEKLFKKFTRIDLIKIQQEVLKEKNINFFTKKELETAEDLFNKLGIKNSNKIICIHNRDKKYLEVTHPKIDWNYHNYRNFKIDTLVKATDYFIEKGYYVFRMGKFTEEKMNFKHKNFFDYANSDLRNDLNDILILSRCYLYLGSDSGIYTVADHFKTKVSFINFPSINFLGKYHFDKTSPSIFKMIKDVKTNRILSIKEMLKQKFDVSLNLNDLKNHNLQIISNSEKDILNLAKEINDDYIIDKDEEIFLKEKFTNIFKDFCQYENLKDRVPNVSISFLKKNNFLLN